MSIKPYFWLGLQLALNASCIYATIELEGDHAGQKGFAYTLGPSTFSQKGNLFLVTADKERQGNEYAIAWANRLMKGFAPLALATIELDGKEKQPNPLTGSACRWLSLMKDGADVWPLVITQGEPHRFYLIQSYQGAWDEKSKRMQTTGINMLTSDLLIDAQGEPVSEILGIAGGYPYIYLPLRSTALAQDEGFDLGVSFFYYGVREEAEKTVEKGKKKDVLDKKIDPEKSEDIAKVVKVALQKSALSQLDAFGGDPEAKSSIPLRRHNPLIALGSPVSKLASARISVHWSPIVKQLYVPLEVTSGAEASDGARALLVGSFDENKGLDLRAIAPDGALQGDSILSAHGSHQQASIFEVASMGTTTWLPYIIVVGGAGEASVTRCQVFALPVVGSDDPVSRGTIAKKDQVPEPFFSNGKPDELMGRTFMQPAITPEDMPKASDSAVCVGGGPLRGPVDQLSVQSDAVVVSVSASGHFQGGIFHSQALFDQEGRIAGWTEWQSIATTSGSPKGFGYDQQTGQWWYMPRQEDGSSNQVMLTEWESAKDMLDAPLSKTMKSLFQGVPSGIQDLHIFGSATQGFSTIPDKQLSVLTATGYRHVTVVQTGKDENGSLVPVTDFASGFASDDGSLKDFKPGVRWLKLKGGVLQDLGPIVASAIVTDGVYGWLAVAGTGGVAVLVNPDGTGWPVSADEGLGNGFEGLANSMRFVKLGAYKNVHKLIAHDGKLLVITPTLVDSYVFSHALFKNISSSNRITPGQAKVVVANADQLRSHSYFLDAWAFGHSIFLATDKGLLYQRETLSCSEGTCSQWKSLEIPYGAGAVSRIYPIVSAEGLLTNMYILSTSASSDQARIYRYVVRQDSNETIELLPDILTKEARKAFFINLGVYRGYFATDGSIAFFTGSSFGRNDPAVDALPIDMQTRHRTFIQAAQPVLKLEGASIIGEVVREPASGAWVAWGDFGVRMHR